MIIYAFIAIAIFMFVSAGFSLGMTEAYLIAPLLNIPSFSPVFGTLCMFGIWVAMLRYRLLAVTDKKVCRDMIETMDAFVLMLDAGGRVVMQNRTAERLLGRSLKDTAGRPLAEVIGDTADCREALSSLKAGRPAADACQISPDGGKTELALRFSPVKDAAGDPLGFMVLGREVKGVRHFRRRFQVTAREWEAIHKLVTGATNREIAHTLGIAERTVKAHLSSVYGKLGVENKVQLIGVLKEHGLY
ncbi:MAG: PAS domain-containing protein [Spirochaetales bacterium]|nr:PAS domain-containing protein [Spirochaetales bacterium]